MTTGHYFQSLEKWTLDRDNAYDFGFISRAMKVARRLRIRDLELVLSFDGLEQAPTAPFEKFLHGLSHNRKHQFPGRQASHPVALA